VEEPLKRFDNLSWSASICLRMEIACVS